MALTDSILAYWKLDNNGSGSVSLLDSTGNDYILSDTGVALGDGIINGGASIDGVNYLNTKFIPDVGGTDFSVSGWFNSNYATSTYPVPFGTSNTALTIYATITKSSSSFRVQVGDDLNINTEDTLNVSTWYHTAVSRQSGTVSIYLNGSLVGSGVEFGPPNLNNFFIGSTSYGAETNFNGSVDEVGIWNRSLSQSEVTALYNGGIGISYPFSTPSSSGGFNLARLIGLPPFIQLEGQETIDIARLIGLPPFVQL